MDSPTLCTKDYALWQLRPPDARVGRLRVMMGAGIRCRICMETLGEPSEGLRPASPEDRIMGHYVMTATARISLTAHMDCVAWCDNLVAKKCDELHNRYLDTLMAVAPLWHTYLCKDIIMHIARAFIGDVPIRMQVILSLR
jgi:hypothetical protein